MEFSKFCCRKQWICSCRMEKKELVVFIPCQQLFLKRENKNKRYFPCKFTQTGQTIKFHIPSSHLPIQKPTVIYKKQAVIKSYPTFPKKALNSIPHSLQEKIKNITTYMILQITEGKSARSGYSCYVCEVNFWSGTMKFILLSMSIKII